MGQRIDLKMISNLYTEEDEKGESKLIKKNIRTKINVDIDNIEYPTQIFNAKGRVLKTQCKVQLKDIGSLTVNHPYEFIKRLKDIREHVQIKGFRK